MAFDITIPVNRAALIVDQLVIEPLMISPGGVARRVFLKRVALMSLSERNDLGQTLGFDRANKAPGVGVQVWASRRNLHRFNARGPEQLAARRCEQAIAVMEQLARSIQEPILEICEIAGDLAHPLSIEASDDPAITTLRVLRPMTKRTKYRTNPDRVTASTAEKSVAAFDRSLWP